MPHAQSSSGNNSSNAVGAPIPGQGNAQQPLSKKGKPSKAAAKAKASEDYTNKLEMTPGLKLVFPVHDGVDTRWKPVGNYDFIAEIEPVKEGYSYAWQMTSPANASGRRACDPQDMVNAHQVSLFYPDSQSCTMMGYTNLVRLSDNLFADIKTGEKTKFELDGPDSGIKVHNVEPIAVPHAIQMIGQEKLDITVNGRKVPVRAIKAQTDNGWHYWILDNARFPIMLKGEGPFLWDPPSFVYAGLGDSENEGKKIVRQLEATGEATTHLILFDFDKATLRPKSKLILNEVGRYLRDDKDVRLAVEGHTDIIGGMEYNMGLSRRRAAAVKNYLINSCSIAESRLESAGFGYTRPLADNKTAAGRQQNRRVVFKKL